MSEASGSDHPSAEVPAEVEGGLQDKHGDERGDVRGDEVNSATATRMIVDFGVYLVARLLLAAVLGVVIAVAARAFMPHFPLTVAALFALVLAMPLGIWVFAPLRMKATASIAAFDRRRRRDREQLRARLRGE